MNRLLIPLVAMVVPMVCASAAAPSPVVLACSAPAGEPLARIEVTRIVRAPKTRPELAFVTMHVVNSSSQPLFFTGFRSDDVHVLTETFQNGQWASPVILWGGDPRDSSLGAHETIARTVRIRRTEYGDGKPHPFVFAQVRFRADLSTGEPTHQLVPAYSRVIEPEELWYDADERPGDFDAKFAVVMIDDRSEAQFGSFPLDRGLIARAVDACARNHAKAVVLKFFFDQPGSAAGDAALSEAMRGIPVALQARFDPRQGTQRPIPWMFSWEQEGLAAGVHGDRAWVPIEPFLDAATAVGFVDFDSTRIPLVEEYRDGAYKSLVVCCLEFAQDAPARPAPGRIQFGRRFLPVDEHNVFEAQISEQKPLAVLSFIDLLTGAVSQAAIEGRVVVIGWDAARTPVVASSTGPIRIHRFFAECLRASYAALREADRTSEASVRRP